MIDSVSREIESASESMKKAGEEVLTDEEVMAKWDVMLAANGFRTKYRSDTATWYKEVDGRYPAVNLFHFDDDGCEMILIFYQESREEILEAAKL